MIKLEKINKCYRGETYETIALDNVNLYVEKGEMISIMGESGSGKSTLLHILGFLDSPTEGKYWFCGKDVSNLSNNDMWKYRRDHIGFVFQNFALIETLTVEDNVSIPLEAKGLKNRIIKAKVHDILDKLHIVQLRNMYPPQISGGQRQRVAIARAIVSEPELILADEPTGALDFNTGLEIMDVFKEIHNHEKTIVIVTHDMKIANLTERVIRLEASKIID